MASFKDMLCNGRGSDVSTLEGPTVLSEADVQ